MVVMMRKIFFTILFLLLPAISVAEVRQVSDRLFWIGQTDAAKHWSENRIFPTKIKWMRPAIWNDPVLGRKTIAFFGRSYVVKDHIRTPEDGDVLLLPGDVAPWSSSEFYDAYSVRRHDVHTIYFIPKSGENYGASCSYKQTGESFLGCTVRSSYPPDKHIDLLAEFYFTKFTEGVDPFKPIASRLVELAYCLDVTHEDPEAQDIERKPLDCEIKITS